MQLSSQLEEKLNANQCGDAWSRLKFAKPDDELREITLAITPDPYMNALQPKRQDYIKNNIPKALWAAGEIAGRGQHEYGGPLVYNENIVGLHIQRGKASAVVALLEKLVDQYLLDSVTFDRDFFRSAANRNANSPHKER